MISIFTHLFEALIKSKGLIPCLQSPHFLNQYHTRTLCSLLDTAITNELDNQVSFKITFLPTHYLSLQVLVEGKTWSKTAVLNRPSVLNCLSTTMVCVLTR